MKFPMCSKFFTMSGSLWITWIRKYMLRDGSFWDARDTNMESWIWHKLLKYRPQASEFIRMEVRNGKTIFFWSDYWMSQRTLIDVIGEVGTRHLGIRRHATVSCVVVDGVWDFRSRRQQAIADVVGHIRSLPIPDPNAGEDCILWRHSDSEYRDQFSASKTWEHIRSRQSDKVWSCVIWFS